MNTIEKKTLISNIENEIILGENYLNVCKNSVYLLKKCKADKNEIQRGEKQIEVTKKSIDYLKKQLQAIKKLK